MVDEHGYALLSVDRLLTLNDHEVECSTQLPSLGLSGYLAPECFESLDSSNILKMTSEMDVYMYGVTLYEVCLERELVTVPLIQAIQILSEDLIFYGVLSHLRDSQQVYRKLRHGSGNILEAMATLISACCELRPERRHKMASVVFQVTHP